MNGRHIDGAGWQALLAGPPRARPERPAAFSPPGATPPCGTGPISAARLTPADTSGRLELLVDGVWGTACEGALGDAAAGVACRQMKLGNAGRTYSGGPETANLPALPVLVTKLACMGAESTLQNCSVVLESTGCTNFEELQCYTGQFPEEPAGSAGAQLQRPGPCPSGGMRNCVHKLACIPHAPPRPVPSFTAPPPFNQTLLQAKTRPHLPLLESLLEQSLAQWLRCWLQVRLPVGGWPRLARPPPANLAA